MPGGFSQGRTKKANSEARDKGAKDQVWKMVKLDAKEKVKEPENDDQDCKLQKSTRNPLQPSSARNPKLRYFLDYRSAEFACIHL